MTPNYQIKYTKEFKKSIKKITKQGKTKTTWSNYDDKKLLNSGYTYTGNKKER